MARTFDVSETQKASKQKRLRPYQGRKALSRARFRGTTLLDQRDPRQEKVGVELRGLEPLTPTLPVWCSPS